MSFSLYLVHIVVREKLRALGIESGTLLFLATLAVGYAVACFLYGRVERPFLRYATRAAAAPLETPAASVPASGVGGGR